MRILVAIDKTTSSDVLVQLLTSNTWPKDTRVTLLHVQEPLFVGSCFSLMPSPLLCEIKEKALVAAREVLHMFRQKLVAILPGATIEIELLEGSPKEVILEFAAKLDVDMIVVGSHDKFNLQRAFLGSVSHALCIASPCSILVIKEPHTEPVPSSIIEV